MRDNDERLRQAIRAGNIGIFDHDHTTDVIYWSPELRVMYGWSLDEPATLDKILSHVHPSDLHRVIGAVKKAHDPSGDGSFDIEHRIIDRQGRVRWVLTRSRTEFLFAGSQSQPGPRAFRTIGAVQDVTDRHDAQERLRVLDTVLSSSAQAIAIADERGTITFANAAVPKLWGYSDHEQILGRSIFDLWETEDSPAEALARVTQERLLTTEVEARRADGSTFFLRTTIEAVRDASGALTQVLVTFTDITDRKRLETQLAQAQKMESIGRLAGGVAHDFNNLLTVIMGGLQLGLDELPPEHPIATYLGGAAEAAQSAASLTHQLLAFSRKEIIAPRVLDLNEVLRRMEKMVVRLVGENIRLQTHCAENLVPICFDPGQVEQIILNLAINARDAMAADGGRLTIETSNVILDAGYAGSHVDGRPGEYVLLAVSDSGAGMTDEVKAHLFEPFFTTKGSGKGTGLGLAMIYGAVQQNGGRIEVYSELGHGTTFKIYIPAAKGLSPAPQPQPTAQTDTRRATILLVEDDQRVRTFAENALSRQGHTVHAFGSGEEALAALPALQPSPELLMTDVVMPGIDGRRLAERVSAALPRIRVLFVSGYTEDVVLNHGVLNAGIEFLAKPYSVDQLARRVREVLAPRPR